MKGPIRVHVRRAAEKHVRSGHPWVYSESIRDQSREGEAGDLAAVYDHEDRFMALGLYDPQSPLRLRIFHWGKPVKAEAGWWVERLKGAVGRRLGMREAGTTGYRLVHGESDGWPGLVVDRYAETVVLKLYTEAWLARLDALCEWMREGVAMERLVLRWSRNLREAVARRGLGMDAQVWWGAEVREPVRFQENGLWFEADVMRGQKTGFFLDQRENRLKVEGVSRGRAVLNLFSYTGGFSVYAARGGARSVTDVDVSGHALEGSRRHFGMNRGVAGVGGCLHETQEADVFEWLEAPGLKRYGLVIVDPPSMAKRESERGRALEKYRWLAGRAAQRLSPGGILVMSSCSSHVGAEEFFAIARRGAVEVGRAVEVLGTTGHPADHPASFSEARYLKSLYLRV